jgi:hypothetical protein
MIADDLKVAISDNKQRNISGAHQPVEHLQYLLHQLQLDVACGGWIELEQGGGHNQDTGES